MNISQTVKSVAGRTSPPPPPPPENFIRPGMLIERHGTGLRSWETMSPARWSAARAELAGELAKRKLAHLAGQLEPRLADLAGAVWFCGERPIADGRTGFWALPLAEGIDLWLSDAGPDKAVAARVASKVDRHRELAAQRSKEAAEQERRRVECELEVERLTAWRAKSSTARALLSLVAEHPTNETFRLLLEAIEKEPAFPTSAPAHFSPDQKAR